MRLLFWVLRRLLWFGTGAGLGFGGAMWVRSRLLRAMNRYVPEQVSADVADSVRKAGTRVGGGVRTASVTVRAAVGEGRSAMAEREAELHDQLRPSSAPDRGRLPR